MIEDSKAAYSTEPGKQKVEFEFLDHRHYYYVRVQQDDPMLAWSSPMFANYQ